MSSVIDELRERVSASLNTLRDEVPTEFHGGAVVEILRTLDWAELYMHSSGVWPEGWRERVRFGTVRALSLFLPGAETSHLPPHGVTEERARWAHSALLHCGTQSLVWLHADCAATGLVHLHKTEPDRYEIRMVHPDSGVEAIERADMDWWRDRIATWQELEEAELIRREAEIVRRLAAVMLEGNDGDQSSGDAEIDLYFEERAVIHSERLIGYDYFPNGARFGGIDFYTYECAVVALLRWVLYECFRVQVQLDLASISLHSLHARELFAPVIPRDEVVTLFAAVLGLDQESATRITDMFTMDAEFAGTRYANIPSAANPPFVTLGEGHLALSLHGALNAPYEFLLARLRHSYPKDWQSAANQNEAVFREQLYTLFSGDRFLCVPREVRLTVRGNDLTDIDAFVLDRETGVAGLFQLKWWSAFGASMRERSSGARNLAHEVASWTARVESWIRDFGLSGLANQASLRRGDRHRFQRVRLFVLGRNYAYFSGQAPLDDEVARGNWHQVLRLTAGGIGGVSPIDTLWNALRGDNPHHRTRPAAGRSVIDARDFSLTVLGHDSDS